VLITVSVLDTKSLKSIKERLPHDWHRRPGLCVFYRNHYPLDEWSEEKEQAVNTARQIGRDLLPKFPPYVIDGQFFVRNVGGVRPRVGGNVRVFISPQHKVESAFSRFEQFIEKALIVVRGHAGSLRSRQGGEGRISARQNEMSY
jgi:hypothetical protein